jgi:hypothetical protein
MHVKVSYSGVLMMQRVVIVEQGVLPVLTLNTKDVHPRMPDGAYYRVIADQAQIIVVGPMHFTPGQYLDALNDLLDERYDHDFNSFMKIPHRRELQEAVLRRGFVDLRFRKP